MQGLIEHACLLPAAAMPKLSKALAALTKAKEVDQGDQRGYTAYHHACALGLPSRSSARRPNGTTLLQPFVLNRAQKAAELCRLQAPADMWTA